MSGRAIGALVLVATVVSWGGRIGLLENGSAIDWVRIVGSLTLGGAAALVVAGGSSDRRIPVAFSLWNVGLWLGSVVSVWTNEHPLGFRLVHTALALTWFGLVALVWRQVVQSRVVRPQAFNPG